MYLRLLPASRWTQARKPKAKGKLTLAMRMRKVWHWCLRHLWRKASLNLAMVPVMQHPLAVLGYRYGAPCGASWLESPT